MNLHDHLGAKRVELRIQVELVHASGHDVTSRTLDGRVDNGALFLAAEAVLLAHQPVHDGLSVAPAQGADVPLRPGLVQRRALPGSNAVIGAEPALNHSLGFIVRDVQLLGQLLRTYAVDDLEVERFSALAQVVVRGLHVLERSLEFVSNGAHIQHAELRHDVTAHFVEDAVSSVTVQVQVVGERRDQLRVFGPVGQQSVLKLVPVDDDQCVARRGVERVAQVVDILFTSSDVLEIGPRRREAARRGASVDDACVYPGLRCGFLFEPAKEGL